MHKASEQGKRQATGRFGSPPAVPGWRRAAVTAVLALALPVALLVGIGPVSAHGPSANGCTGVPDSGHGFRFHSLCDRHDRCYGTRPYGAGSAGRATCDRVFRSQMLDYCSRHRAFSTRALTCRAVAGSYHLGVRILGAPFWSRGMPTPIA